jgi:hypothetical protein
MKHVPKNGDLNPEGVDKTTTTPQNVASVVDLSRMFT